MKAVLQRITQGKVVVDDRTVAEIGGGLVILLGVGPKDTNDTACALAKKCAMLRIFSDPEGKMNLSLKEIAGQAIVVSQFTLYADARKGLRPSFTDAAPPDLARPLVDVFAQTLRDLGIPTGQGEFGAHMQVELVNDGPVTILLEM